MPFNSFHLGYPAGFKIAGMLCPAWARQGPRAVCCHGYAPAVVTAWFYRYRHTGTFFLSVCLRGLCSRREDPFAFWRDPQRQLTRAPMMAAGAVCTPQGAVLGRWVAQRPLSTQEALRHRNRRGLVENTFHIGVLPGKRISPVSSVGNNLSSDFSGPFRGGRCGGLVS